MLSSRNNTKSESNDCQFGVVKQKQQQDQNQLTANLVILGEVLARSISGSEDTDNLGVQVERIFFMSFFGIFLVLFFLQNVNRSMKEGVCGTFSVTTVFQTCGFVAAMLCVALSYDLHGRFGVYPHAVSRFLDANAASVVFAALASYVYVALNALNQMKINDDNNFRNTIVVIIVHFVGTNLGVALMSITDNAYV